MNFKFKYQKCNYGEFPMSKLILENIQPFLLKIHINNNNGLKTVKNDESIGIVCLFMPQEHG